MTYPLYNFYMYINGKYCHNEFQMLQWCMLTFCAHSMYPVYTYQTCVWECRLLKFKAPWLCAEIDIYIYSLFSVHLSIEQQQEILEQEILFWSLHCRNPIPFIHLWQFILLDLIYSNLNYGNSIVLQQLWRTLQHFITLFIVLILYITPLFNLHTIYSQLMQFNNFALY